VLGHGHRLANAKIVKWDVRPPDKHPANVALCATMPNEEKLRASAGRVAKVKLKGAFCRRGDLPGDCIRHD
jgi:hypothetical protein